MQPKRVTISPDGAADFSMLDRDISGVYEHCPECATSLDCLYRRISTDTPSSSSASSSASSSSSTGPAVDQDPSRPMFFFHDPERCEEADKDSFVFADNCDRLDYKQSRNEVCRCRATSARQASPGEANQPINPLSSSPRR